jgi:oxygen-independent coproporphyrinogen-3 oxidase
MWLTIVETEGHGLVEDTALSAAEQGDEFLLMGLRLGEGIDPARFTELTGERLDRERIAALVADGLIEAAPDGRLRVTAGGFPILDSVVADLAA